MLVACPYPECPGCILVSLTSKICNRLSLLYMQIPVHPGCHTSIIRTLGDSSFYHGKDGLGDAPDDIPPDESLLKTQHGVSAIVDIAKKYSGE